jgi:hypothetical protein
MINVCRWSLLKLVMKSKSTDSLIAIQSLRCTPERSVQLRVVEIHLSYKDDK